MLTMVEVNEMFKDYYLDVFRVQIDTGTDALAAVLDKTDKHVDVTGEKAVWAFRYGRQGGFKSAGTDHDDEPSTSSRKTKQGYTYTKNLIAKIYITDKVMKAARRGRGAFATAMELELQDATQDAKEQYSRQLHMDGSGVMATTAAMGSAGKTFTINETERGVWFAEGMRIDVLNHSSPDTKIVDDAEITNVDDATGAITVDTSSNFQTAAGNYVVIADSYNNELTGLNAVFKSSGSIYGLDRADYKFLVPQMITVGDELSEIVMQRGEDAVKVRTGAKIDFWITTYGVQRAYQYMMSVLRRNIEYMKLKGGYEEMSYKGKPIIASKYTPAGVLRGLVLDDWRIHQLYDWDWLDADGAVLKKVANKTAYEAVMTKYADLGCYRPKAQLQLSAITEH
ncbi:MAG TPA: phage major capsid protein [Bacillota bacterium]|nr:phage major capsid protein [Bacillota bacterium]